MNQQSCRLFELGTGNKVQIFRRMIFIIVFLILLTSFAGAMLVGYVLSAPGYNGPVSDHFDGKRFMNPGGVKAKGFKDLWKWMRTRERGKWEEKMDIQPGPPPESRVTREGVAVTFVNHSTFLIQFQGLNILTDPIWSKRASPFPFAGPRRMRPPGIRFEDLPSIDIILLTHNHYDHLDIKVMKKLWDKFHPAIYCTLGVSPFLRKHGIERATEMDWWDESKFNADLKILCTPAQHFSGRGMYDRDRTLWSGFAMLTGNGNIYYTGDTGYGDFFNEIRAKIAPVRLSFIPIGAYKPAWFMGPIHTGPAEAIRIHQEMESQLSIAMHFGTFPLADDSENDPQNELQRLIQEGALTHGSFLVLEEGKRFLA